MNPRTGLTKKRLLAITVIMITICCSALAYILYLYALKYLGATVVTTFINFIPVCGVMGGVIFWVRRSALNN